MKPAILKRLLPFTPDQLDATTSYTLDRCPDCGGPLKHLESDDRVVQQVEIVVKPVTVTEHLAHAYRCAHCGKAHDAPMPPAVTRCGLIGPNPRITDQLREGWVVFGGVCAGRVKSRDHVVVLDRGFVVQTDERTVAQAAKLEKPGVRINR